MNFSATPRSRLWFRNWDGGAEENRGRGRGRGFECEVWEDGAGAVVVLTFEAFAMDRMVEGW